MIIKLAAALLIAGSVQAVEVPAVTQSANAMVNKTEFYLVFRGRKVSGCTITATSGNPKVDEYICSAARTCGDRHSNTDRRASCLADKRRELADRIAKDPDWLNW